MNIHGYECFVLLLVLTTQIAGREKIRSACAAGREVLRPPPNAVELPPTFLPKLMFKFMIGLERKQWGKEKQGKSITL